MTEPREPWRGREREVRLVFSKIFESLLMGSPPLMVLMVVYAVVVRIGQTIVVEVVVEATVMVLVIKALVVVLKSVAVETASWGILLVVLRRGLRAWTGRVVGREMGLSDR